MKRKPLATVTALALVSACVWVGCASGPRPLFSERGQHILPESRLVAFSCEVNVSDIPDGAKEVRLWVPFPSSGRCQQVITPAIEHPNSYRPLIRHDARYETPVLFVSGDAPLPREFNVSYLVRAERAKLTPRDVRPGPVEPDNVIRRQFAVDLMPSEGVNVAELERIVAQVAPADNSVLVRARAIYDFVIQTVNVDNATTAESVAAVAATEPDESEPAAGVVVPPKQRTVMDILATARGNRDEYALVTVALLRAAGIPARVESGVMLPEDRTPDRTEVTGTATWVRFYVNGFGWSACDPYLAHQFPELKEDMFAGLCANRIQLGVGPEPLLVPAPQTGIPTVFATAIAEVDGKPVAVRTRFFFQDVSGGPRP